MRTVIIAATACLTAGTFFGAERLISSNAEAVALEQQTATQATIESRLKQSNAGFAAEIAALKDASASSTEQVGALTSMVETLTAKRNELAVELITAQDDAKASLEKVAEVTAMYDGLVEKVSEQDAAIAERDVALEALRANADPSVGDEDALAALSDELAARDATIASLNEAIETAKVAQPETAVLNTTNIAKLNSAKAQITAFSKALRDANTKVSARDETIAALETKLSVAEALTQTADAEAASAPAQAPSASQEEQVLRIAALDAQVAELSQIVETQTDALANLRLGFGDKPVAPMEMAEVCIARASGILESTQITFGTGTSSISSNSIATLESLRDLAIGCKNDDVIIEIGGHTDSFGAEAANQALSEARAASVKEFLVQRGIPAENMIAVGFGETDPVASNDTPVGRAANRRITFMWQMREPAKPVEPVETAEPAEPVEPATTSVDG